MEWSTQIPIFLGLVLVGSYVQSVTGFAMGMIITAAAGGTLLYSIPTVTAVVSLLSLVNVALALRGQWHQVHRPLLGWLSCGQVPGIALGLMLMLHLDVTAQDWLYLLLGLFITLGSLSMVIRPQPRPNLAPAWQNFGAGFAGGLVGGMFSASGPVMGWYNYKQPLAQPVVRATLLGCFGITGFVRSSLVGFEGGLTSEVWSLFSLALPAVVLGTWLGNSHPPKLSELAMKRGAFALLFLMGLAILAQVLQRVL